MRMSYGKLALVLVIAGAVLFGISGIGQDSGYWKDGPTWLGDIGWLGFGICLLLLVLTGVAALVSRLRHHGGSVPH